MICCMSLSHDTFAITFPDTISKTKTLIRCVILYDYVTILLLILSTLQINMKLSENPSILGRPNVIVVMETSLFDILALNNVSIFMKYIFAINIREVSAFY